jgi:hypothetical protein
VHEILHLSTRLLGRDTMLRRLCEDLPVRDGRNERPQLALDWDRDDRGAVRLQCLRERRLYLFPRTCLDRRTAKPLGCGHNVQRRKIQPGYVGSVLKLGELLQDCILTVARNDIDHLELVLRGGGEARRRTL